MGLRSAAEMHGGTNDLCVEELSAGESSATRTLAGSRFSEASQIPSINAAAAWEQFPFQIHADIHFLRMWAKN